MKKEIEKDIFEYFEKREKLSEKIKKLTYKAELPHAINDKLHHTLRKDIKRIFFKYTVFEKHCNSLRDNAKKIESIFSEAIFISDEQEKMTCDMENIIKMTENVLLSKLFSLFKKRDSLLNKSIKFQKYFNSLNITFADAVISTSGVFERKTYFNLYSTTNEIAEKCAFINKRNLEELDELNNEIALFLKENIKYI